MKNNIILIIVVTLISIAVIIISIAVSTGGKGEESSQTVGQQTSETSQDTEPSVPDTSSEPVTLPEQTTQAQSTDSQTDETDEQTIGDIISLAGSLIGTDFADGGESPSMGFDNSGYIYYVLRENGYITCPRGVAAQSQMGTSLEYAELSRGDLVFFSESGTQAEFGGIYIGDGKMLACLMPGTQVKEVDITTSYYTKNFYCGVRIK